MQGQADSHWDASRHPGGVPLPLKRLYTRANLSRPDAGDCMDRPIADQTRDRNRYTYSRPDYRLIENAEKRRGPPDQRLEPTTALHPRPDELTKTLHRRPQPTRLGETVYRAMANTSQAEDSSTSSRAPRPVKEGSPLNGPYARSSCRRESPNQSNEVQAPAGWNWADQTQNQPSMLECRPDRRPRPPQQMNRPDSDTAEKGQSKLTRPESAQTHTRY
jgi:hypothetical protein